MPEYRNGRDLTRAAIDADGRPYTGDIGAFQGRHLFIRGNSRKSW
jgi:long-subunit acyl-CoA synthetase (AMP-forming)